MLGWVIFIAATVLIFVNLQNSGRARRGPLVPRPPFTRIDEIAVAAMAAGVLLIIGTIATLVRLGRRPVKILAWHCDDSGVYTTQADGEYMMSWEWISNVTAVRGGVLIERVVAPTRFFPDSAFDNDAERQAFLDTYARHGIPAAKEVQDDGPRGFAI